MATLVKPISFAKERWMRLPPTGGLDLFMFSGFARFGETFDPIGSVLLHGTGENDTLDQKTFVEFEITDMLVGPHWQSVREVCPLVVVAAHQQVGPDEADGMGYQVTGIKKINLVDLGGFSRIELQVTLKVAGGDNGRLPSLAYHVTALGRLQKNIGNEGVFFGNQ